MTIPDSNYSAYQDSQPFAVEVSADSEKFNGNPEILALPGPEELADNTFSEFDDFYILEEEVQRPNEPATTLFPPSGALESDDFGVASDGGSYPGLAGSDGETERF